MHPGMRLSSVLGPPAFDPTSLASLLGWYTPGPTWCFQDTAGTTPCTVGSAVARWNDRSGNSYNLTQASAGLQPILRQTGALYYVEFDGVDDGLTNTSIPISGATTMCFGANQTSAGTSRMLNGDGAVSNALIAFRRATLAFYVNGVVKTNLGIADSTTRTLTAQKAAAGNWGLRINAVDQAGLTANSNEWGTGLTIGGNALNPESFAGAFFPLLVYNANYTGAERTSIESYIAGLSGL